MSWDSLNEGIKSKGGDDGNNAGRENLIKQEFFSGRAVGKSGFEHLAREIFSTRICRWRKCGVKEEFV